ncbi:Gfo/Idh/MocA family oxidoreductase [Paenibacillus sp. PsM32]|uniref:Gfo/Idh/MocA family protein n=1 Tax=Paenibacillus sp. PsM32 TaxID=3030536 RepID=UPI00263AA1E7|nr:Gfo/Idh/MocA family oxidoreductase [Paenibacillus sp. PsM32]MDN4618171.1 Gfo/Idh/MocA family oxidoreductase [Paenibacillus sp. PsM32]
MKLGIVGSGMIVEDLLSFIGDIPTIQLQAICARAGHEEKLAQWQTQYKIDQVYVDYDQLLADQQVDTIYIGLPNHLHYSYAKQALEQGKHVICEKPFTSNLQEFLELKQLATRQHRILVEAISNQYLKNVLAIREQLPKLGDIKIVECNYSQFSSRYRRFKNGEVLSAFNPAMSGGALMDINVYNIHLVVGLFGLPKSVHYHANIERGIDTSGILLLDYDHFKCVCIGSKDTSAPNRTNIQGDQGYISIAGSTNIVDHFEYVNDSESPVRIDVKDHPHRMYDEFVEFERIIYEQDMLKVSEMLEHSEKVMHVIQQAKQSAGLVFGADH